jgi:hypothetical protein
VVPGVAAAVIVLTRHAVAGRTAWWSWVSGLVILGAVAFGPLVERLLPFVDAGDRATDYRRQLLREVPPATLPDDRPLAFFTNLLPLPNRVPTAELRYFWPVFDPVGLSVLYQRPLPRSIFLRSDLGPGWQARIVSELQVQVQISGHRDRDEFLAHLRQMAAGKTADPSVVVVFWHASTEHLERISNSEIFR